MIIFIVCIYMHLYSLALKMPHLNTPKRTIQRGQSNMHQRPAAFTLLKKSILFFAITNNIIVDIVLCNNQQYHSCQLMSGHCYWSQLLILQRFKSYCNNVLVDNKLKIINEQIEGVHPILLFWRMNYFLTHMLLFFIEITVKFT